MTTNIAPALPSYSEDDLATLTPTALVELLIRDEDRAPRIVIDRCAACGEEMVEFLRARLDKEHAWRAAVSRGEWWLRLHAAMILGLIASDTAGLVLVHLMRRMSLAGDESLQDWLAGYWPALFANKSAAVIEAALELCENRSLDWYIRLQAASVVVGAAARAGREQLDRELDWLADRVLDDTEDWNFRTGAGNTLLDFPRERHRRLLVDMAEREAALSKKNGWMGVSFSVEDIDASFNQGTDMPDWRRRDDPWHFYARGSIARRQDRREEEAARRKSDTSDFDDDAFFDSPVIPYVRPAEKIGRNDPCPCGSGRKYKKCCLPKEQS